MAIVAFYVLITGAASAVAGVILQRIGAAAFSRFGAQDTKELAAVAGIRIAAVFGIAVALIFSASHAYYNEAKRDLAEEVRLIGTLLFIATNTPGISDSHGIRTQLTKYAQALAKELDQPQQADETAAATNLLLLQVCTELTRDSGEMASAAWLRTQIQASCSKLIDLRGKMRVRMSISNTEAPFWIFFGITFVFLAVLLGVFESRPLNFIFSALFFFVAGATALLIYWMSDPYHGPSRIASTPFSQLIAKMDSPESSMRMPGK